MGTPRACAYALMAAAMGCSLPRSAEPAARSNFSSEDRLSHISRYPHTPPHILNTHGLTRDTHGPLTKALATGLHKVQSIRETERWSEGRDRQKERPRAGRDTVTDKAFKRRTALPYMRLNFRSVTALSGTRCVVCVISGITRIFYYQLIRCI